MSVTISPIRDDSEGIIGASKIARDIAQRKQERELLRGQADPAEPVKRNAPVQGRESRLRIALRKRRNGWTLSHVIRTEPWTEK